MTAEEIARGLEGARGSGGQWSARCPAHEDTQASLSLTDRGERVLVKCHAGCSQREVVDALRALGLWPAARQRRAPATRRASFEERIERTYDYVDESGALLFQAVRLRDPKAFRQRRPNGGPDSWDWRLGDARRVLYRLPEVVQAVAEGRTVYVVEGEKDADRLAAGGLVATSSPMGAGKWRAEYATSLDGATQVVVIPDADGVGGQHAADVAASLRDRVHSVRVLELPGLENRGDVSDWLDAGGTPDALARLVEAAPEWDAATASSAPTPDTPGFIADKDGKILASVVQNIRLALDGLGVDLWYDEFADRLMGRRAGQPFELEDHRLDRWWIEIDAEYHFRPTDKLWRTVVLDAARQRVVHPVRDYLEGLTWDGRPRLDRWLVDHAGAEDTPYTRAVSSIVLVAAVRRIRQPGCKFDEMLVLESPQGTEKSSALAALCPDPDWFDDNLPLDGSSKEVIEQTSGRWIIEAAELSGMRQSEIEKVKAFLSRRVDRARMAYARLSVSRPRHFIVIGSTNSDHYLRDTTGNRRFWPVRTLQFDSAQIARDRDLLWAEAAAREADGESIRLDSSLWIAAGHEQNARGLFDEWERILAETLDGVDGFLRAEDAWRIVGVVDRGRRNQHDNRRLGEIMQRLGFERLRGRRRPPGENGRVYVYLRGYPSDRLGTPWIECGDGAVPAPIPRRDLE